MQVMALRVLALSLAVVVPALAAGQSHAKDTGLIFVSNEKTNNLIVVDPKSYQIVKDIKVARRPRDMSWPMTSIRPESAVNRPDSSWNKVDFPAPLGPSKAMNSPPWARRLTPSTARICP